MPEVHRRYMGMNVIRGCKRNKRFIVLLLGESGNGKINVLCEKTMKGLSDYGDVAKGVCFDADEETICVGNNDGSISVISFL